MYGELLYGGDNGGNVSNFFTSFTPGAGVIFFNWL
jgi:hypothetical protein